MKVQGVGTAYLLIRVCKIGNYLDYPLIDHFNLKVRRKEEERERNEKEGGIRSKYQRVGNIV